MDLHSMFEHDPISYPLNDHDLQKRQDEKERIREEILGPMVARRRRLLKIKLKEEVGNPSTSLGLCPGKRPDPVSRKVEYDKLGFPLSPPPDSMKKIPDPIHPPSSSFELPNITEPCVYCSKVGHSPSTCSYRRLVPKGETVGPGAFLMCKRCKIPLEDTCCGCGSDETYAMLKDCLRCGKYGFHWADDCPDKPDKPQRPVFTMNANVWKRSKCPGRQPDPVSWKVEYDKLGFPLSPPPDSMKKIPDPIHPHSFENVEQKEPAKLASVKSNAGKDDDSEDDHDGDDVDDETHRKRKAQASVLTGTPASTKKTKIDTDCEEGAQSNTLHHTEKGSTLTTDNSIAELPSLSFDSDGGL